jgi:hypothetical protein
MKPCALKSPTRSGPPIEPTTPSYNSATGAGSFRAIQPKGR